VAFDTASDNIALAVGRWETGGPAVPVLIRTLASNDHSAIRQANVRLMPAIAALFAEQELPKHEVSAVVCGLGPGSFTGVRIGVASAKGIARGLRVPLFGVSTLEAVAWGAWLAGVRGLVGVVADAMRGEVYPLRFVLDDVGVARRDAHTVATAADVAARWREAGEQLLLVGDGLGKYAEVFVEQDGPFALGDAALWKPTGAGLLRAFEAAWARGEAGDGEAGVLLPIYTRLSDAEENERKRLAAGGPVAQGAMVEVPLSGVADPLRSAMVTWRPMAAADLDQVCALEQAAFAAGASTSGERWSRAQFGGELAHADRVWWVAYVGDVLVGFAGGWVVDGQLQVLDVAVESSHRRRGIARELLERLMSDAFDLGATEASLEVRESNEAARALYAAMGFERIGVRPSYYAAKATEEMGVPREAAPREAAVILSRPLRGWRESGEVTSGGAGGGGAGGDDADGGAGDADGASSGAAGDSSSASAELAASDANPPRILAIETSCDETAAAVISGEGRLLSNIVASQVDFHARFGGVVPEIASRKHLEASVGVVDVALEQAGLTSLQDLDALAVTYAPGLIGALVVGVAFAKGLAWATGLPLVRVNHLEGHIYANRMEDGPPVCPPKEEVRPPFVVALLSGGHTMLVHVRDWGVYRILGQTLDDAVGEAFDKVAKALGLGYPGGPAISRLAAQGDPAAYDFPRALLHSHDYRFSLSGLKTAVITFIKKECEAGRELVLPNIAASFQQAVIDVQVAKALAALEETGCDTFCVGGGVAANQALRTAYGEKMRARGIRVIFPPREACTDNAAMIARVALDRFRDGNFMALDDDAFAQANLELAY
jgi:N6-L-threonylcarbamoyladenine synthase